MAGFNHRLFYGYSAADCLSTERSKNWKLCSNRLTKYASRYLPGLAAAMWCCH